MKLTKRDKTLLYILAIVVTLAVFIPLVILPQWERRGKLADQLTKKEQEVSKMQTSIAQIESNKQTLVEKQAEYENTMKNYYPLMESYALERMITKIALEEGLAAKDFEISVKPFNSKIYPYFASELAAQNDMTDLAKAQEAENYDGQTQEESKEDAEDQQNVLYSSKVQASAVGERSKIEKLIDRLYAEYPAIRIMGYEIESNTVMNADNSVGDTTTFTFQLEIYMCQK